MMYYHAKFAGSVSNYASRQKVQREIHAILKIYDNKTLYYTILSTTFNIYFN